MHLHAYATIPSSLSRHAPCASACIRMHACTHARTHAHIPFRCACAFPHAHSRMPVNGRGPLHMHMHTYAGDGRPWRRAQLALTIPVRARGALCSAHWHRDARVARGGLDLGALSIPWRGPNRQLRSYPTLSRTCLTSSLDHKFLTHSLTYFLTRSHMTHSPIHSLAHSLDHHT